MQGPRQGGRALLTFDPSPSFDLSLGFLIRVLCDDPPLSTASVPIAQAKHVFA
jgi:hypothetical protein